MPSINLRFTYLLTLTTAEHKFTAENLLSEKDVSIFNLNRWSRRITTPFVMHDFVPVYSEVIQRSHVYCLPLCLQCYKRRYLHGCSRAWSNERKRMGLRCRTSATDE